MKFKKIILTLAALSGFFITQNVQATCANFTTYIDGQVLTGASLNSLQTNYTNCINGILDGDTLTGNMLWHSGSDILMYSDTGTTRTVEILGNNGNLNLYGGGDLSLYSDTGSTLRAALYGNNSNLIAAPFRVGDVSNCSIGVSGSTFSISGEGGVALSATNPCIIRIRSNTSGQSAIATFTADIAVTFGATSNTDGNTFGINAATNWANSMPIFMGVIYNGTTPYLTISRIPITQSGAAATDLCQLDDTDCDAQSDVMVLTTGLTLASWVNLPTTQVGWFQATWTTTNDNWDAFTVNSRTGFNFNYESEIFTFPQAQNGGGGTAAASGTHILANGGTPPQCTTEIITYTITKGGICSVKINYASDAGTDGSGAVDTYFSLPFSSESVATVDSVGTIYVLAPGVDNITFPEFLSSVGTSRIDLRRNASALTTAVWQHADFSNGNRIISGNFSYRVDM